VVALFCSFSQLICFEPTNVLQGQPVQILFFTLQNQNGAPGKGIFVGDCVHCEVEDLSNTIWAGSIAMEE